MPSSGLKPGQASVLQGRIMLVDAARWICTVYCDSVRRELTNVIIPSLYSTPEGEGIHYMPEVGAVFYVCMPSDGASPFLLLSAPQPSQATADGQPGSFHFGRPYLSPGDLALTTRDGNGIIARRGGVTELRGSPLSRIMTNPFTDQVLTIARNWRVETLGGSQTWTTGELDEAASFGLLSSTFSFEAKEFIDSVGWSVSVDSGYTGERLELDAAVPAPALIPTPSTLYVEGPQGARVPYVVNMQKPASLDPAGVVYRFRVNTEEDTGEVVPSFSLEVARKGDARLELDGKVRIAAVSDQNTAQPVMLGTDFLTKLQASLTEIKVALTTLGLPTVATDDLLGDIVDSLAGQGSFLSSVLEAD